MFPLPNPALNPVRFAHWTALTRRWLFNVRPRRHRTPLPTTLPSILLLFLFVGPGTSAFAANWVDIAGNNEVTVFIDTDSIRRNGTRVKTWLKWQWIKEQDIPNSYPPKRYLSEKQLQVSDCQRRTLAIAQGVRYSNAEGTDVIDSYAVEERKWQFTEVVPETIGETIVRVACKPSAKRSK